jgi:hypothetical protein
MRSGEKLLIEALSDIPSSLAFAGTSPTPSILASLMVPTLTVILALGLLWGLSKAASGISEWSEFETAARQTAEAARQQSEYERQVRRTRGSQSPTKAQNRYA